MGGSLRGLILQEEKNAGELYKICNVFDLFWFLQFNPPNHHGSGVAVLVTESRRGLYKVHVL